jgi:diguanylate cyclase (GGDEF)-like protein
VGTIGSEPDADWSVDEAHHSGHDGGDRPRPHSSLELHQTVTIESGSTNEPIRRRVLTSLVVGLGLLAMLAAGGMGLVAASHDTVVDHTTTMTALSSARRLLIQAISLQETAALDFELTRSPRAVDEFAAAELETDAQASRLIDLAGDDPMLIGAAGRVIALGNAWRDEWARPLIALLQVGRTPPVSGPYTQEEGVRRFAAVKTAFDDLDGAIDQRRAEAAVAQAADANRLVIIIGVACAAFGTALLLLGIWLLRTVSGPLARLSTTAASLLAGNAVSFRAERDDEIGTLAHVLERQRLDAERRFATAMSEAERSATYNKLAELISFSATEDQLVEAAVRAIRRLTSVPNGAIQLANPSQVRLVHVGAWGDSDATIGQPVPIDRMDRCPGIRRASAYLIPDVEDELAVRCPANSTANGAAACVPMMALGQVVGVIHLGFAGTSNPSESVAVVARVAEQIAIALANARLMKTLEGLAMTDSLTGLHNARFFDSFLEQQLAAMQRDAQPLGVIMMDIDHFKQFNDTHGHPGGDEALRMFGRVVRSALRASDVVARYGGEEFIVALPGSGQDDTRRVAEKLRKAVEEMVIEIGPGRYARATVSLGVVATDQHRLDQKGLVAMADAALYRAKEGGRNQVATAPPADGDLEMAANRRRGGTPAAAPIAIARRSRAKPA